MGNVPFEISPRYLSLRDQVLRYSNVDMNLPLEDDRQVYIGVFDFWTPSGVVGLSHKTLALVFGLNAHLYVGDGGAVVDLEKQPEVMRAMASVLVSSSQAIDEMPVTESLEFYESKNTRVYLKTLQGVHFRELQDPGTTVDRFLRDMLDHMLGAINSSGAV